MNPEKETDARILIDVRLREAGWEPADKQQVRTEVLAVACTFTENARAVRQFEDGQTASRTNIATLFQTMLHRAFTGELAARWREAHRNELLAEVELQSKAVA